MTSGNNCPSHGPHANTNASAATVLPSESLTPRNSPAPRRAPGSTASWRYSPPSARKPSSTAAHALAVDLRVTARRLRARQLFERQAGFLEQGQRRLFVRLIALH